jgi:dihydroorotate dehydrogenase (fumarate)
VIKQILAGANAVQICSTLYKNGVPYVKTILDELEQWMKQKGYENLNSFRGLITRSEENTAAFERVQFMKKTTGQLF